MKRLLFVCLFALPLLCCGLAEDEQDDKNKRIYITFTDPAFEAYCLREFDLNGDGRVSVYEAERIRRVDCPGLGIRSLSDISYFKNLRTLDCSDNLLTDLDLRKCPLLTEVDCSGNRIGWLDVRDLRGLRSLYCSNNLLGELDLQSNASLSTLVCRANALRTLDVSGCARRMELVDATANPSLAVLYIGSGQDVSYLIDGPTRVEVL